MRKRQKYCLSTSGSTTPSSVKSDDSTKCSSDTISFGNFTQDDLHALDSLSDNSSIPTKSITKNYASVLKKDIKGSESFNLVSNKKRKKKHKELQIGDQLQVTVRKSKSYGTFVDWYLNPSSKRKSSGMIHKSNYTTSNCIFKDGEKLTVWFQGFADFNKTKYNFTLINPHLEDENNY